jgi:ribonuclease BN (tRNA processing enzyme)
MRLVSVGVGDAFSTRHYSTCLALVVEDEVLLIDCPHPVLKMLREAGERSGVALLPQQITGVVLTHLHADHASGLETLAYYSFFVLGKRLRLATHPEVAARLWEGCLAAGMEQLLFDPKGPPQAMKMENYFELIDLSEKQTCELGVFQIQCRKTIHHIPTTAVVVKAGGCTLGYSADTTYDEELIAWLHQAELVLHETGPGIHTPYEKLAQLPGEQRDKMRLVHYPDQLLIQPPPEIQLLAEGQLIQLTG